MTFYPEAQLAAGVTTAPTHLLYEPHPATVGGVVGKYLGAPIYDSFRDIGSAMSRLFSRNATAPDLLQHNPAVDGPRVTPETALAVAGVATATTVACQAGLNAIDWNSVDWNLTKALGKAVFINFAGGLTLFLYGMKLMDDGLKAAAGDKLKNVIHTLTKNRYAAFGVGAGVTAVIQSSSITTVTTLSLVNAELMMLSQALAAVAGANVGTTATVWAFATNLAKAGPLMMLGSFIGRGLAKSDFTKNALSGVFGLGMVFFGLTTMSAGFKHPEIQEALRGLFGSMSATSMLDVGACIGLSALMTACIQSSSAMMVIAAYLAGKGVISHDTAVALALGSNAGTTITAWLANLRSDTTTNAKRVAAAHTLFNVLGVLAIWPWSHTFASETKNLADSMGLDTPELRVALAHTLFNVITSVGYLAGIKHVERLVTWMFPEKIIEEVGHGQQRLKAARRLAPPLALDVSHEVITEEMSSRVQSMLDDLLDAMRGRKATKDIEVEISGREDDLDELQRVLFRHFNRVEQKNLGRASSATLDAQRHFASNLEAIGDHLENLVKMRLEGPPLDLSDEVREDIARIHKEVIKHFELVSVAILENNPGVWETALEENDKLKGAITKLQAYIVEGPPESQIFYQKTMALYREIVGNVKNMAEALADKK